MRLSLAVAGGVQGVCTRSTGWPVIEAMRSKSFDVQHDRPGELGNRRDEQIRDRWRTGRGTYDTPSPSTTGSTSRWPVLGMPLLTDAGSPCELLLHEGPDRCDEVGNDDCEAIEHLFNRHGWTTLPRCLHTKHGRNHFRPALKRIAEELIGRFNSDTMGIAGLRGALGTSPPRPRSRACLEGRSDTTRMHREQRKVPRRYSSEGPDWTRWSVAQAQSFGLGAHFVERCSPLGVPDSLIGQRVSQAEAAVVADGTSTRQHALVDQPDQVWPGDVEQVGRFLRGELSVHGKNGDGVTLRELANDAHQYLADRAGQFHRFASSTEQCGGRRLIQSVTHQREKSRLLRWREDGFGVVGWYRLRHVTRLTGNRRDRNGSR